MQLPRLKIGKLVPKIPIVQGGMAVKISTAPLAAAVANEGGIGLIAGSGLKVEELIKEIKLAKKLSKGIIGVNIMVAVTEFKKLVNTALNEGINIIVAGAGFSRDLFDLGKKFNVEVVPIVSSVKLAKISEKLGASAVVVEGKEAGGHLGTDQPMKSLIKKVTKAVKIPVIAAGGIINGKDMAEVFKLGADGVQMGSRFVASEECEADENFKLAYINATENDGLLIDSPVGLPGRALKNKFIDKLNAGEVLTGRSCAYQCLKKCTHSFCIMEALVEAQKGNMEDGLIFAGERAHLIDQILPVKEIIKNLINEAKEFL